MLAAPMPSRRLAALLALAALAPVSIALADLPSWLTPAPGLPADRATPLPPSLRRIAEDVPDEGTPLPDEHYPVSNEHRHDLWFPHVRDLGGAFVGVGTDQCYTLAAIQNAERVWIVDFDPLVPIVHRMYEVLVPASPDPDALVARFAPESEAATTALLRRELADDPRLDAIVSAFRRNRERMHRYLRAAARNVESGVGATWLADPELYGRVQALHRGHRVIARNGDVTADGALRAVGRAAARLHLPVRVIYFSNAEQFFRFGDEFRANLDALPTDPRSVVLRTFREQGAPYPPRERWHYMVQPVDDMRARITENGYRHSRQLVLDLMASRAHLGAGGVSVLDAQVRRRVDLMQEEDDE
jgi:hypothetical protein